MKKINIVIIGGGPAGMAAAISSYDKGERDILILEREPYLGGILNQCIHNGFGLHTFKEELTGPEYAAKYEKEIFKRNIQYKCGSTVLSLSNDKIITYVNEEEGLVKIEAKAVILACGCRERPRGAINIAGCRSAGIFSAGAAQKLVNIDGFMPGKEVVILGSGDIGLIMARRMTFEGAKVKAVIELMPYSSGLNRNIVQCLNDFSIPLLFSHTIIDIKGKGRVSSVVIAKVDEKHQPISGSEQEIQCDTLLLSVGLLPENELAKGANVKLSSITGGGIVDDDLMTSVDGVFSCGNVLHVHDLVDFVSQESTTAGGKAAEYVQGVLKRSDKILVNTEGGVRYAVPFQINKERTGNIEFKMRVSSVVKGAMLEVLCDGEIIVSKKRPIVTPGEMETISLNEEDSKKLRSARAITIRLNGGERR